MVYTKYIQRTYGYDLTIKGFRMAKRKRKPKALKGDTEIAAQKAENVTQRAEIEKDVQMVVKMPIALRTAFVDSCKANDRNASQVLREFMRKYLAEKGQSSLL